MGLFLGWGIILQAIALIHFARRRPDTFWLWIIIFGSGLGALIYLVIEAIPDLELLRGTFRGFPRRKRIRELQALVVDNPAPGNYEELADLYFEEGEAVRARDAYDRAISTRTDSPDPFYRRGICHIELGEFAPAKADLERVVAHNRKYDYHRALGLLAHATARVGEAEKADALFREALTTSTLSETQFNYACFLATQRREAEARELARSILSKKPTLPHYLRRRERPWFRRAQALLKQLPAASA